MAKLKRKKVVKKGGSAGAQLKRGRGRPVTKPMPERIDASPERIAEVVLKAKPKREWQYTK